MNIYQKLTKVIEGIDRVPKNGKNTFQKYDYVIEADLLDHIRPLMTENGLAFNFTVEDMRIETVENGMIAYAQCKFTVINAEKPEEKIESIVWGSGYDKQDKALYKAYTGATKYFLMKSHLVSTGDDPEDDKENYTVKSAKKQPMKKVSQLDATSKKKIQEPLMNMINELAELTDSKVDDIIKEDLSGKNIGDLYQDEARLVYKALATKIKELKK